ncbi:MAG TPA: hypothetical protein VHB72_01260 [Candidatus Saccharimonadales bacterium]|nr:hypothetical protein [Candidatus Saccharimonadales bacterium]
MKRTIERATAILAATASIAAGSTAVKAETASAASPQARAMNVAKKITKELYNQGNSKGVPVPGILNGSVEMAVDAGAEKYTVRDQYPIILVESHSPSAIENNPNLLNGSWVGMPDAVGNGRVAITPYQIKLGKHNQENITLDLANNHEPVLNDGAGVEAVPSNDGIDKVYAIDLQGGSFGKHLIQTVGVK